MSIEDIMATHVPQINRRQLEQVTSQFDELVSQNELFFSFSQHQDDSVPSGKNWVVEITTDGSGDVVGQGEHEILEQAYYFAIATMHGHTKYAPAWGYVGSRSGNLTEF